MTTTEIVASDVPDGDYAFSNSAAEAQHQLAHLETLLDPTTTTILNQLPIPHGARCLEIGPGAGSIARWLAHKTGPTGLVIAVDKDTSRIGSHGNLDVIEHDIRHGLPVTGPFDLIHARLVLLHLPQRLDILHTLTDALTPGGWLILGEFNNDPLTVHNAPSLADSQLFTTVTTTLLAVLEEHGADMRWANGMHRTMLDAGLTNVHTSEHAGTWTGATPGCLLHKVNSVQKQDALLAHGITIDDLTRFRQLMDTPDFTARSYRLVYTRGQRARQD